jgi:hypothetical protein
MATLLDAVAPRLAQAADAVTAAPEAALGR